MFDALLINKNGRLFEVRHSWSVLVHEVESVPEAFVARPWFVLLVIA